MNAFSLVQCVQKGVSSFEKGKFLLCLKFFDVGTHTEFLLCLPRDVSL